MFKIAATSSGEDRDIEEAAIRAAGDSGFAVRPYETAGARGAALEDATIATPALAATEREPPAFGDRLLGLAEAILTAHSASDRSRLAIRCRGVERAIAVWRGALPRFITGSRVRAVLTGEGLA